MGYKAKVLKVFIASPSDVNEERTIVREVLAKWNAMHSDVKKIVLLPVGWETHSVAEIGKDAQDYINEELLDECDILVGIFWTRIGAPTRKSMSGSVEEIFRNAYSKKRTMVYFSEKDIPRSADLDQLSKVNAFRNKLIKERWGIIGSYENNVRLAEVLLRDLEITINKGEVRPTWDSDRISKIENDHEMVIEIAKYKPLVSRNLMRTIYDEVHEESVWNAILDKLEKSPADFRETLLFLARENAFANKVFKNGCERLAKCSLEDYEVVLNNVYSINEHEFRELYNKGLLQDNEFKKWLDEVLVKEGFFDRTK